MRQPSLAAVPTHTGVDSAIKPQYCIWPPMLNNINGFARD